MNKRIIEDLKGIAMTAGLMVVFVLTNVVISYI